MSDPIKRVEDLAERRIQEAMAEGAFDDLPGSGKPLPDERVHYDPAWWSKRYMNRLRDEDEKHDRVRELTVAVDDCWTLPEAGAAARFSMIHSEWAALADSDPSLPRPPTQEEFRATWKRMRRAR